MTSENGQNSGSQRKYWILFASVAAGITILDLLSKHFVFKLLQVKMGPSPFGDREVVLAQEPVKLISNFFWFEANVNYGAFSGWFSGRTLLLSILSVVALCLIAWFLWSHLRAPGPHQLWFAAALGLLWGGTCGNFYDRVVFGYVRDFIRWFIKWGEKEYVWPNFNIADSAITVGVCVILAMYLFAKKPVEGTSKT